MTSYVKPNTSADYRASAQECGDRAQRSLEVAEVCLETVADLLNLGKEAATFADLIAHAEARIDLGQGWRDLAALRSFGTEG